MTPLGVAEDTEGSIRVPAALCGTAGFRPSTGRYPNDATAPTTTVFDQLGPHARSVEDLLLFDAVVTGSGPAAVATSLRGIRLGIIRPYFWKALDPEVERIAECALDRLRRAGAELIEGELPELQRLIELTTRQVQFHDFRPTMTDYLHRYHVGLTFEELIARSSPAMRRIGESMMHHGGRNFVPDHEYQQILAVHLPALRTMYRDYFRRSGISAIVFPACILPAPLLQSPAQEEDLHVQVDGEFLPFDVAISRNIAPGSTAGLPGLVLPAGLTRDGLPVALEFDGPAGCDAQLLSLGLALEAELGRLPPPLGALEGQYGATGRVADPR
jgi:mandelamide amidase